MINVGIIGLGYWGPNYVRIVNELEQVKLESCCDLDKGNLKKFTNLYPFVKTTSNYKELISDERIDAVIITTPPHTHYQIAKDCLEKDKHVLVEKPLANNSNDAKDLVKISEQKGKILMVGHVYKYNPGIRKLKELISSGDLGDIFYITSERMGLGPIRKHGNALWDLATHDISIATYLLDSMPNSVNARGECYIQNGIEDLVFLTLNFPNKIICNIIASWFSPEKIRRTNVVGSEKMAVFDDVNKSEMIKIYERKIDKELLDATPEYSDHQLIVRFGNVLIPRIEQSEPLKNMVTDFCKCISENKKPLCDGLDGLNVVKILEAANKSLKNDGTRVNIDA